MYQEKCQKRAKRISLSDSNNPLIVQCGQMVYERRTLRLKDILHLSGATFPFVDMWESGSDMINNKSFR